MSTANPCGGCTGMGAHKRWCEKVVGWHARRLGIQSERAEALADEIGASVPSAANACYWAASRLSEEARKEATVFQNLAAVRAALRVDTPT